MVFISLILPIKDKRKAGFTFTSTFVPCFVIAFEINISSLQILLKNTLQQLQGEHFDAKTLLTTSNFLLFQKPLQVDLNIDISVFL